MICGGSVLPMSRMCCATAYSERGSFMNAPVHDVQLAHNVSRLSHLDLPGAGQVYVDGKFAYIGHIPNKQQLGTSILDVSDPKNPKVVSQIHLDDPDSHSHKARVIGDI